MESLFKNNFSDFCKMSGEGGGGVGSVPEYLFMTKSQILMNHKMRMQKSTINIFILDQSLGAVASVLLVNIPWKCWRS